MAFSVQQNMPFSLPAGRISLPADIVICADSVPARPKSEMNARPACKPLRSVRRHAGPDCLTAAVGPTQSAAAVKTSGRFCRPGRKCGLKKNGAQGDRKFFQFSFNFLLTILSGGVTLKSN